MSHAIQAHFKDGDIAIIDIDLLSGVDEEDVVNEFIHTRIFKCRDGYYRKFDDITAFKYLGLSEDNKESGPTFILPFGTTVGTL